jgi:hypothetical protein
MTDRAPSAGAVGGVVFAATMMLMTGIFQVFQGLAAILNEEFYIVAPNYVYELDVTTWGWIHLILGALVALAGFFLFSGSAAAGIVAITLALFSAISNFFFIPYYPLWSLLLIGLAVWVIWAIPRSGILDT